MTFDEFRKDFMTFLASSNVNLGRKKTKTRDVFLNTAAAKFDAFLEIEASPEESSSDPMKDSVMCIKPQDANKGLSIGKGVHSMTASESMRADEQLNRSPYGKGSDNG